MSAKPPEKEQWVNHQCECGSKGGAYLKHYEVMRCACGEFFWALRPRAAGLLVLFPWPGQQRLDPAEAAFAALREVAA